jgi:hypothetical protein
MMGRERYSVLWSEVIMGVREETVEQIQTALQSLRDDQLRQVLRFVERLEHPVEPGDIGSEEPAPPLYRLHTAAVSTGIPDDLAHQHDHYLYGLAKRDE